MLGNVKKPNSNILLGQGIIIILIMNMQVHSKNIKIWIAKAFYYDKFCLIYEILTLKCIFYLELTIV